MLPVTYDMDTDAALIALREFRTASGLAFTDDFAMRVLDGVNLSMRSRTRKVTGPEILGVLKATVSSQNEKEDKGTLAELMAAFWDRLIQFDGNLQREPLIPVPEVSLGRVKTVKLMALIRQGWKARLQNGSIELIDPTDVPSDLIVSVTASDSFAVAFAIAAKRSPLDALVSTIPKKPKRPLMYA